jgi:hypothetical protein
MDRNVVFVSYSHDSDEHLERVLQLSERLRADGLETALDQYLNGTPEQGWPRWMLDQLDAAERVLVVCTETYYRRFRGHEKPGKGKGAGWEGTLITQKMYDERSTTAKFVPVLLDADQVPFIPEPLRSCTSYTLTSEATYRELLAALHDRAGVEPGPIGNPLVEPRRVATPLAFPSGTGAATPRIAPSRLTHVTDELFGREAELARLEVAWQDPKIHLITLVAWGGMGKTSLVAKWAADLASRDYDGASYFDWSFYSQGTGQDRAVSSDTFFAEALRFFGDPQDAKTTDSGWAKGERLAKLLARRRTLLVLDGLEPLQYGPGPAAGQCKEPAMKYLLRGLAQRNPGLCLVTTRDRVADLVDFRGSTAPEWALERIATPAGMRLLERLGVTGTREEIERLVEDVGGHALTLSIVGTFLVKAHGGDVRQRDRVDLQRADQTTQDGHASKAMEAYEYWLSESEEGKRQLAILRLLGLFDRPADGGCLAALRQPPPISGLTDPLMGLDDVGWNLTCSGLVDCGLAVRVAAPLATQPEGLSNANFDLDTHPLVRQHFAKWLVKHQPKALNEGQRRLAEYLREREKQGLRERGQADQQDHDPGPLPQEASEEERERDPRELLGLDEPAPRERARSRPPRLKSQGRLGPYIETEREEAPRAIETPVVRALLREHAIDQAYRIITAIEKEESSALPPALIAVDRETGHLASRRVANMLRAFLVFLRDDRSFGRGADPEALHLRVFDPLSRLEGTRITSPALLVLQAVLYSHIQWLKVHHHEAHSAWTAYGILGNPDLSSAPELSESPCDRAFIVALIAHQTRLRAAWNLRNESARKEVAPLPVGGGAAGVPHWKEKDDHAVAAALARTLYAFPCLEDPRSPEERARLSSALVLFSLCLEFRHQRLGDPPGREILWLSDKLGQALAYASTIAKASEPYTSRLLHWQYGHYVFDHLEDRRNWSTAFADELRRRDDGTSNLTFSFDPSAPRSYWPRWLRRKRPFPDPGELPLAGRGPVERRDPRDDLIAKAIQATVGLSWVLTSPPATKLLGNLGVDGRGAGAARSTIGAWLAAETDAGRFYAAFDAIRDLLQREGGRLAPFGLLHENLRGQPKEAEAFRAFGLGYFPAPLVGRILREMRRVRPRSFTVLRLRAKGLPSDVSGTRLITEPLTVYLPPPGAAPEHWDSTALIARYVAAMVINLQVGLAPQRIDLDFLSESARHGWDPLIQAALRSNGHQGIIEYLEQFRAEVCKTETIEALTTVKTGELFASSEPADDLFVLGLDIGAGSVKAGRFCVRVVQVSENRVRYALDPPELDQFIEFPTAPPGRRYRNAADFAAAVLSSIGGRKPSWLQGLLAVGVAWPGAIRGGSYVAAGSGILRNCFEGMGDEDPRKIHQLDLKEAFEKELARAGEAGAEREPPIILVLNDGDADVRGEEPRGPDDTTEGVAVVLKQGTGTACGVFVGGVQVPALAEMGKAVLNLEPAREAVPESPGDLRFPEGTVNKYCSKKTLPAIAEGLGWKAAPGTPPIDAREVGYFLEEPDSARTLELRDRIARDLVYARFSQHFDGPGSIVAHDPRLKLYYPSGLELAAIGDERIRQIGEGHGAAPGLAVACAEIAGSLLADAIALLIEVFRCREVRLGGSPLSGETGERLSDIAQEHLERYYGFEVIAVRNQETPKPDLLDPHVHAAHVLRDVSKIRLIHPQGAQGHTGERGAAGAALDAWVRETKRRSLAALRSSVSQLPSGETFTVPELLGRLEEGAPTRWPGLAVVEEEVADLLQKYTASLALTFQPPDRYLKL